MVRGVYMFIASSCFLGWLPWVSQRIPAHQYNWPHCVFILICSATCMDYLSTTDQQSAYHLFRVSHSQPSMGKLQSEGTRRMLQVWGLIGNKDGERPIIHCNALEQTVFVREKYKEMPYGSPRVFGDKLDDKFGDQFGDSPYFVINLVTMLVTHFVSHHPGAPICWNAIVYHQSFPFQTTSLVAMHCHSNTPKPVRPLLYLCLSLLTPSDFVFRFHWIYICYPSWKCARGKKMGLNFILTALAMSLCCLLKGWSE